MSSRASRDWQKLEVSVEGVIHINLHIFVSKKLGKNTSADRKANSGKMLRRADI